jgi:methylmalonyl-CoA mutase N-terminal domain/subunit
VENGSKVVVGVNKFRDEETSTPALQKIDPEGERRQCERVQRVRAERDAAAWEAAMARLEQCARGQENLLPPMIEAVKAYATVGEVCDRLRSVWGEHRELITI